MLTPNEAVKRLRELLRDNSIHTNTSSLHQWHQNVKNTIRLIFKGLDTSYIDDINQITYTVRDSVIYPE